MAITVRKLLAYEIQDSNGNPTIEVELLLSNGFKVTSSASSDNVVNTYGMRELRDNDMQHYQGLGVKGAVSIINGVMAPRLVNVSPLNQWDIDGWLNKSDNSPDKSKLGVNTTMVISQAFAKAGAYAAGVPLFRFINDTYTKIHKTPIPLERIPTPCIGMLAGGKNVEFEEFQIIPSSSLSFSQAYEICDDIYHALYTLMEQGDVSYGKNQFGEYIPKRPTNIDLFDMVFDSVQRKNLKLGKHLFFGVTINANHFFLRGKYSLKDRPTQLNPNEYYDFLTELITKYSILLLEDPFASQDIDGWKKLFVNFGEQIYIVGHKYVGENPQFFEALENDSTLTSFVIKPGYFGTITDTLRMVNKAKQKDMSFIVSSDRNDTDDDFIADFAMGVQADFIKFGAPSQGERIEKYNRLLKIEQMAKMGKPAAPAAAAPAATPAPVATAPVAQPAVQTTPGLTSIPVQTEAPKA